MTTGLTPCFHGRDGGQDGTALPALTTHFTSLLLRTIPTTKSPC